MVVQLWTLLIDSEVLNMIRMRQLIWVGQFLALLQYGSISLVVAGVNTLERAFLFNLERSHLEFV